MTRQSSIQDPKHILGIPTYFSLSVFDPSFRGSWGKIWHELNIPMKIFPNNSFLSADTSIGIVYKVRVACTGSISKSPENAAF